MVSPSHLQRGQQIGLKKDNRTCKKERKTTKKITKKSVQVQKKDTEKGGLSGGGSDTGRGLQGLFEPSRSRNC